MQELGRTGQKPSVPESPRLSMKSDCLNWRTVPPPCHQTALDSPGKGRRQTIRKWNGLENACNWMRRAEFSS